MRVIDYHPVIISAAAGLAPVRRHRHGQTPALPRPSVLAARPLWQRGYPYIENTP